MSELYLRDYKPESKLVVKETRIEKPRFSAIDAHNHLGETFGGGWINRPLTELIDCLDAAGIKTLVDLDGGWGEAILERHLDHFKAGAPERFIHFGGVDWSQWEKQGNKFGEWAAHQFEKQVRRGAQGLKIWKPFGLSVKDNHANLVAVDDARLDPIWARAGELGLPVLIHVADPVAFFDPIDEKNERWEELQAHPDWHFQSPPYPPFMAIMEALKRLVMRHPATEFIGAHGGCYSENLAWVGELLDAAPNFNIDFSARISEFGRQPYTARRFFVNYADRILFGTDLAPALESYQRYYRFLESDDEYFNYDSEPIPGQGRWYIYGLHLPDEVLSKVYFENAQRVLGLA